MGNDDRDGATRSGRAQRHARPIQSFVSGTERFGPNDGAGIEINAAITLRMAGCTAIPGVTSGLRTSSHRVCLPGSHFLMVINLAHLFQSELAFDRSYKGDGYYA